MNLFKRFQRWRQAKQICKGRIPLHIWDQVVDQALFHFHLNQHELHRLRELSGLFLQKKTFEAAGGMELADFHLVVIASQACLLILNLNMEYYAGWQRIIVYPDSFYVQRNQPDELGLVHNERVLLGGEAWSKGPLILSWHDAKPGAHIHGEGSNVILHEFAHKLDMLRKT